MKLSNTYKEKIRQEVLLRRANFTGSDSVFAKTLNIDKSQYSRAINKGELEKVIGEAQWLQMGIRFGVKIDDSRWKIARTAVYIEIEDKMNFCQRHSSGMMIIEDCGVGKTVCSQHIARGMTDAFYIDCSQHKTVRSFIRGFARTVGLSDSGSVEDIKMQLKQALKVIGKPLIILDEFGDLSSVTYLHVKEIMNASRGVCGWLALGAEGLEAKINRGINGKKVGYKELFSRLSRAFAHVNNAVNSDDKKAFYTQLIGDVASANVDDPSKINELVKECMSNGMDLRYLETRILEEIAA